jgi:hypothetical protein
LVKSPCSSTFLILETRTSSLRRTNSECSSRRMEAESVNSTSALLISLSLFKTPLLPNTTSTVKYILPVGFWSQSNKVSSLILNGISDTKILMKGARDCNSQSTTSDTLSQKPLKFTKLPLLTKISLNLLHSGSMLSEIRSCLKDLRIL